MTEQNYGGLRDVPANASRRDWIDRMNDWLDVQNAKADRILQSQEYREIRIGILVGEGMTKLDAFGVVYDERKEDIEAFEGRAVDLFAYRQRLTEGDGAISCETFQHSLDKNPQRVLDDSRKWGSLRVNHSTVAV